MLEEVRQPLLLKFPGLTRAPLQKVGGRLLTLVRELFGGFSRGFVGKGFCAGSGTSGPFGGQDRFGRGALAASAHSDLGRACGLHGC